LPTIEVWAETKGLGIFIWQIECLAGKHIRESRVVMDHPANPQGHFASSWERKIVQERLQIGRKKKPIRTSCSEHSRL
jgi:hypothetical protein